MKSSAWLWRTIGIGSVLATVLLLSGFLFAIKDVTAPQTGKPAGVGTEELLKKKVSAPESKDIRIVSLGDSLAKGTGDDTGEGFVRRTVNILQDSKKKPVQLVNNLGINGLTTKALLPSLDEPSVQYAVKNANVILLSIGGNDLFQGAQNIQSGKSLPAAKDLLAAVNEASGRLKKVIDKLHGINPAAQLVYVGLYNPFNDLTEMRQPGNQAVMGWNALASEIMNGYEKARLVSTFDIFVGNVDTYLSDDHFHPNGAGYQQIAQRIAKELDKTLNYGKGGNV